MSFQQLPFLTCIHCGKFIPIKDCRITQLYFTGVEIPCPYCKGPLDLWDLMLKTIREDFSPLNVFALIGAQGTVTTIQMRPDEPLTLKLTDIGIPEDAKVLDINYTSQGGSLVALESHTNNPHRFRHNIRHEIVFHPVPFRHGEPKIETKVAVFITWAPHTANDEAWENLISSCRSYYSRQYVSAVLPANVAVEARLSRLLTSFLEQFVGKKRVARFLEDGATYSHQLNVLLPVFATLRGVGQLPDLIRSHLNTLRSYRNDIGHKGAPTKKLEQDEMANCLCAALFAFQYLNLIESGMLGRALDPTIHSKLP
jgi:hypothetical protein